MSRRKSEPRLADGWRQVAAAVGGAFVEGTFLRSDRVEVARGGWTVTLDTEYLPSAKTDMTRVRAEYASLDGLRLRLYRRHAFTPIGALLGLQDVEVGDPDFDHAFVIKANDEAKARALLSDRQVRAGVAAEPRLVLAVENAEASASRGFVPPDAAQLSCTLWEEVWDVDRLGALIDLVAATLVRLRKIGSAPPEGLCGRCGYNLVGNVSGVCPECGHALPPRNALPDAPPNQKPRKPRRRNGARGRGTRRKGTA